MIILNSLEDFVFHFSTNYSPKYMKEVYTSLEKDDSAGFVMDIYERIKYILLNNEDAEKSEEESEMYRMQGNEALKSKKFQQALTFYNLALVYAPKMSWALKAAYSNRSQLLLMAKEHVAALKDIEMCFELGCPDNLLKKLTARKETCMRFTHKNHFMEFIHNRLNNTTEFLQLSEKRNPQIPCASETVGVSMVGPHPTVIAAKDIKPGTLVAIETAFVTAAVDIETTCYYCLKTSLNLIPCDDCCVALFCDQDCKARCLKEYHEIECKILNRSDVANHGIALKAVIKIKNQCSSWHEFIQAYENNCSTSSSIKEIFNETNKFSLLHKMSYSHMYYGKKFNLGIITAVLIKKLCAKKFFPTNSEDRKMAMRATAGMFMFLTMYVPQTNLLQATRNNLWLITSLMSIQLGLFSFIGKLKHSCNPNLVVVGLKNKAALFALHTIPRGTTMTIPYIGHHFIMANKKSERAVNMLVRYGVMCSCWVCAEEWCENNLFKDYSLTEIQKKYLNETDFECINGYPNICKGLDMFRNLYNTDVYRNILRIFMRYLLDYQYKVSENNILEDE